MNKKVSSVLSLLIIISIAIAWQWIEQKTPYHSRENISAPVARADNIDNTQLLTAYKNRLARVQVKSSGIIVKVLRDDLDGSRHQRLIVKVNDSQTLLIAHNIDLASRIPAPKAGRMIMFYGEYIWNNKGGVIHWTHKDPRKKHVDGWLKYEGQLYQ